MSNFIAAHDKFSKMKKFASGMTSIFETIMPVSKYFLN